MDIMEKFGKKTDGILSILPRYGRLGASSRLRHYAFLPALSEAGIPWRISPFFRDRCLQRFYASGRHPAAECLLSAVRRSAFLLRGRGPLWIEYEPFPGLPPAFNAALLKGRRYVLSFDDAVWAKRVPEAGADGWAPLLRGAAGIVAANPVLGAAVAPWQKHVLQLPTPVDLAICPIPGRAEKFDRFTAVWIGTPATYRYLQSHGEALRAMAAAVPELELLVIARRDLPPIPGVPMRCVDWENASAPGLLARAHVGIMPLDDDPFSRGKSAYKLIQYLAAGVPSIASPVGENCRVVVPGENGFLARNPAEWAEAIALLASDAALRNRMGEAARVCAGAYDLAGQGSVLIAFLRERLGL